MGSFLLYASPSNLSPASAEYEALVAERVEKLRAANPDMDDTAIPVDLVTCSGSGLDPHISPAAAEYQVARIAKVRGVTEDEVRDVIAACTTGRFLGVFGGGDRQRPGGEPNAGRHLTKKADGSLSR